jgi:hypothetical protein
MDGNVLGKSTPKGLKEIYLRDPTKKIPTATELAALDQSKDVYKLLIELAKSNKDAYSK